MKYILLLFISVSSLVWAQKPCGYKDGLQEGSCKEFFDNGQVKNIVEWKKANEKGMRFFIMKTEKYTQRENIKRLQSKGMELL